MPEKKLFCLAEDIEKICTEAERKITKNKFTGIIAYLFKIRELAGTLKQRLFDADRGRKNVQGE